MKSLLAIALLALLLPACGGAGKQAIGGADGHELTTDVGVAEVAPEDLPADLEPADLPDLLPPDTPYFPETVDAPDVLDVPDLPDAPDVPDLPFEVYEQDLVPQESAAFRITGMTLTSPEFCYPLNLEVCVPVLDTLNDALADSIAAGDTHVVGRFEPFAPGSAATLTLGQGQCELDAAGTPTACGLDPDMTPAQYDEVLLAGTGTCSAGGPPFQAPCFATGEADMALDLYGVVLGLSNVTVAGRIAAWPPNGLVAPARLQGYLPAALAKTVQVSIPADPPIVLTVYELLKESPTPPQEVDGHTAWPVVIEFTAKQVAWTP